MRLVVAPYSVCRGFALYLSGTVICYKADSLDVLMFGRLQSRVGVAGPYYFSNITGKD